MADHNKMCLTKIITTLAVKNEEVQNFVYQLQQTLKNVEDNSERALGDLEVEYSSLYNILDELKENMVTKIKQERASKTYELQNQLTVCTKALESSEELLEFANQTLDHTDTDGFNQCYHGTSFQVVLEGQGQ